MMFPVTQFKERDLKGKLQTHTRTHTILIVQTNVFDGYNCRAVQVYSVSQKLKNEGSVIQRLTFCLLVSPEILTLKEVFQISSHGESSTASPTCLSASLWSAPHLHTQVLPLHPRKRSPTEPSTLIPSPLSLSENSKDIF